MILSEELRSISRGAYSRSSSAITHLPLCDLCSSNIQLVGKIIWHLFISKQWAAVQVITSDRPYSRQLKETPGVVHVLLFEEFALWLALFVAGVRAGFLCWLWLTPPALGLSN